MRNPVRCFETNLVMDRCENEGALSLYPALKKDVVINPNPFNPETSIKFFLEENQRVSLTIYNIIGEEVRTILDQTDLFPMFHEYSWDGINNACNELESGPYFLRMDIDGHFQTFQLLMLKQKVQF